MFGSIGGAVLLAVALGAAPQPPTKTGDPPSEKTAKPGAKPPTVQDLLGGGSRTIVVTVPDFEQMDRPTGVFVPGGDAAKLQSDSERNRKPRDAGVARVAITGELHDAWAKLTVVVEARLDDPRGGDLLLNLQEGQCSEIEVNYREANQDPLQSVPLLPAPIQKADALAPYTLKLERPGAYRCRMTMFVEIDRGPLERQLSLTLPDAPVKSISLVELGVRPGLRIDNARQGRTEKPLAVEPDGKTLAPRLLKDESLALRWRIASEGPASPTGLTTSVVTRYRLQRRKLETVTEFAAQCAKERTEWRVRLPAGDAPLRVQVLQDGKQIAATLAAEPVGEETRVRIRTTDKLVGAVKVLLISERRLPALAAEGVALELPPATLEDAATATVHSVVDLRDDDDLRLTPQPRAERGAESVQPDRVDSALASGPRMAAFQLAGAAAALGVRVERLRPAISVAGFHVDLEIGDGMAVVTVESRLGVRQGALESVRLALPESLVEVTAKADGAACVCEAGERANGVRVWTTRFGERRTGDVAMQWRGKLPLTMGAVNRMTPPTLIDAPDAAAVADLFRQPGVHVALANESFAAWQPLPATTSAAPSVRMGVKPWLTLRPKAKDAPLAFTPERRKGQTLVGVEHRLRVIDERVRIVSRLRWESLGEPLSEVEFEVPTGVSSATVRGERLAAPTGGLAVGAGVRKLALAAPSEVCDVTIEYDVPDLRTPDAAAPLVRPKADSLNFCWAELLAASGRRAAIPNGWTAIPYERIEPWLADPDDPPLGLLVQTPAAPSAVDWRSEPAGALADAVIPRAAVVEEIAASGRRRGRLLAVVAHARTPALSLSAPTGATVAEVLLDGKPTAVSGDARPDGGALRLRVPTDGRPFTLEIRYEANQPSVAAARDWSLAAPRFLGNVALDECRWSLTTPSDLLLIGLEADVEAPPPNLWAIGGKLPGRLLDSAEDPRAWLEAGFGGLAWNRLQTEAPRGRRWTFASWGNGGAVRVAAVREPFWILAVSGLGLLAAAGWWRASARVRNFGVAALLAVGFFLWAFAPSAFAWVWIGGRWAALALTIAMLVRGGVFVARKWRRRRYRPLAVSLSQPPKRPLAPTAVARISGRGSSLNAREPVARAEPASPTSLSDPASP